MGEAEVGVEFIYGYGRTKHILSKRETRHFRGYSETVEYGLCGAVGGHPFPDPLRPVCKRCAKTAAQHAPHAVCTCEVYVVDYSDPERYHPENLDREGDPNCPFHGPSDRAEHPGAEPSRTVEPGCCPGGWAGGHAYWCGAVAGSAGE